MHDARAVRRGQSGEDRIHDGDRLGEGEAFLLAHQLAQGDPRQVLHDEVRHLAVLALVEDVDDVRVGQSRGRTSFLDEAVLEDRVIREVAVHDLERDSAFESKIGGDVDGGHTASRDAPANPVPAVDQAADQRVGLRGGVHVRSLRSRPCEPG